MSGNPNRQSVAAGDEDVVGTDQPKEAVMFEAVQRYRGVSIGRDRTFPALRERETQVFGLSALAIVAYRLDDAFLQMNPGTSPGDHLGSGLVPVALLLVTLLAWPIMATSIRAARLAADWLAGTDDRYRDQRLSRIQSGPIRQRLERVARHRRRHHPAGSRRLAHSSRDRKAGPAQLALGRQADADWRRRCRRHPVFRRANRLRDRRDGLPAPGTLLRNASRLRSDV